ncbi:MAG: hypothetical protein ABJF11_14800 [Reichenbachiella sp.]|uniref:hypothetical protein n=1 Tax=Reichenbachiella sp. TaxID=2184521 RepID=UPI003266FE52
MNSARRLLIPIDFSPASKAVVKYALIEEEYKNDHILMFHSFRLISDEFSDYRYAPRDLKKRLEKELSTTFQEFNQDLIELSKASEIEFRMEVGFMVNCINTICSESKIDMILYTFKQNKEHAVLADLIELGCAPILLIPETINPEKEIPLSIHEISKDSFNDNWIEYMRELESNSNLSYKVMPM